MQNSLLSYATKVVLKKQNMLSLEVVFECFKNIIHDAIEYWTRQFFWDISLYWRYMLINVQLPYCGYLFKCLAYLYSGYCGYKKRASKKERKKARNNNWLALLTGHNWLTTGTGALVSSFERKLFKFFWVFWTSH